MKKFIRKHSPPDMEGGQFTPVSILKKPRVTEAVNTSVRKVVLIADKDVNEDNEEVRSNVSEPDSEDSAMCVKEEDSDNLQSMDVTVTPTPGSVADRERRKWENAVSLSNNPYTEENIVRRKSVSSNGEFVSRRPSYKGDMNINAYDKEAESDISSLYVSMYQRDYYIHQENNNIDDKATHEKINKPVAVVDKADKRQIMTKKNSSDNMKADESKKMAEFSIFSPYEDRSKDSSEDNLDDSLDDGGAVPDSGVSEAGSQMSEDVPSEASTISVSDEIRRFQKEINSVAVENSKFFKWKQQRTPSTKLLSSSENLQAISYSSEDLDKDEAIRVNRDEKFLQQNKKILEKKVSYSDKEVTVLGIPEEIPDNLVVKNDSINFNCASASERSRQIQPSSHVAPSYLPNGDIIDDYTVDNYDDNNEDHADDEDDEVPALPSVKLLTNKFQSIAVEKKKPIKTEINSVAKIPVMLKKKYSNSNCYKQVHSITARSVSRQFRESLKAGKPELVDTIFKLPEAKHLTRLQDTVSNSTNEKQANIVYSSEAPNDLYPNGDYITSNRRQQNIIRRQDYSSEEEGGADEGFRNW